MKDFKKTEAKWREYWEKHPELYRATVGTGRDLSLQKKYVLVEFPYPSGSGLHIGHTFSFTGGDIYAFSGTSWIKDFDFGETFGGGGSEGSNYQCWKK